MKVFLFILFAITISACKQQPTDAIVRGPRWVTFTHQNSPLLHNVVNAFAVDLSGRVWMGTDSGASGFYKGAWSNIVDSLGYSDFGGTTTSYTVISIAVEKDGSIWFGLHGGGARRLLPVGGNTPWQKYTTASYMPSDNVQALATVRYKDPGDVWFGAIGGTSRFIPGLVNPALGVWHTSNEYPLSSVYAITVNPKDNLPIFGTSDGIAIYDDVRDSWTQLPIDSPPVISVAVDLQNVFWMGKWSGMTRYDRSTGAIHDFTYDNTGGQLPLGYIHAVTTDLGKTRWFGTDYGLVRFQDTTWTTFTHATTPELPNNVVNAIIYDSNGNLWIGTNGGVAVYNEEGTRF